MTIGRLLADFVGILFEKGRAKFLRGGVTRRGGQVSTAGKGFRPMIVRPVSAG